MVESLDILCEEDINMKKDQILNKCRVAINVSNSDSVHEVTRYKTNRGNEYYIFKWEKGTTIMNYCKDDYKELSKYIKLDDRITIFMDYKEDLDRIPLEYRYE